MFVVHLKSSVTYSRGRNTRRKTSNELAKKIRSFLNRLRRQRGKLVMKLSVYLAYSLQTCFSVFYIFSFLPAFLQLGLSTAPVYADFFAQSMHIKLNSPQAARRLGIFYRKISSVAPPRGT